jgi:hypothetical protein
VTETLTTLWLVALAVASVFFVGLPITQAVVRGEDRRDLFWVAAPLLGLSGIVLAAQNLVYWNVPVRHSAGWLWLLAGVLFAWWCIRCRAAVPRPPSSLLLGACVAYGIHGYGLLVLGASSYVGYGWLDQFNYTATAQFLLDYPSRVWFNDVGNVPYLTAAVLKKQERIGQGVFHAFVAASGFVNAKTAYGPVSLLSPFLTVLAAGEVARRAGLGAGTRSGAALAAGLVPGLAMIHLECFFSQALAVPMLLIWPVLIERVLSDPRWHTVASAAIVLAAANAIYTELTPLFVALGIAQWGWRAGRGPGWWARSLAVPACLAGALVLNPWFAEGTWATVNRTAVPGILSHVYPFAMSGEGVMRMWSASDYRSRRHSARTSTRPRTTTLGEAPVA